MPSEQIERPIGGLSVVPEKLQLEINLRLLTLGLVFLPILLALGFWQLDRADEKRRLLEIHQAQQLLDPISLNSLNLEQLKSLIPFTKVQANAEIEEGIYWLLDNRINRGRVGYEVLQVAKVDGSWLLINRGWVKGYGHTRTQSRIDIDRIDQIDINQSRRSIRLAATDFKLVWPYNNFRIEKRGKR